MLKEVANMKKLCFILLILLMGCSKTSVSEEVSENLSEKTEKIIERVDYTYYNDIWKNNYQINEDYIGDFWFDSELIHLPFVQGKDNGEYLYTDWKTMEELSEGSAFMDYRNQLDDQNIIMYGHYVYEYKDPTRTRMFTPLQLLKEEENYEENKFFNVLLNGKLRRYQIAVVFYCPLYFENGYAYPYSNMRYNMPNYEREYFEEYKKAIYEQQFYDSGVEIMYEDKLMTFQTCVENREDLRLIIVAKMIEEIDTYPEKGDK